MVVRKSPLFVKAILSDEQRERIRLLPFYRIKGTLRICTYWRLVPVFCFFCYVPEMTASRFNRGTGSSEGILAALTNGKHERRGVNAVRRNRGNISSLLLLTEYRLIEHVSSGGVLALKRGCVCYYVGSGLGLYRKISSCLVDTCISG